ncbi:PQQ-dependent sugar dehydrogenase [Catenuloplanes atrovinosus]|uniref:Glucose/arabinose dehydrogenase n=1 Tax=Catenuloplanes atrovinosus TaxID=137266 RepID=A0AAE3YH66_9ACTN|nr:PQQ-dependent sugar dehydrogenase [Catenuloplanes atrovinosus]MDR7273365.1 glucose/arabinose dehydrogenase [Catenuloplanes atrovinosus]
MRRTVALTSVVALGLTLAGAVSVHAAAETNDVPLAEGFDFNAPQIMAEGLEVPWGLTWLPDGDALVAERMTARLLRISADGGTPVVAGTVPGVSPVGEAGLLGLAVSPDEWVYAYLTSATDNRIVRFRLDAVGSPQTVLTGIPRGSIHAGGRIAFGPDGKLYAGAGDAGTTANAQNPASLGGKILRMNPDGTVPADNPTAGSLVYSLGHRNVQGLAWDAAGRLYASEFGQNTWDEVNLITPGANYGWPVVEGDGNDPRYVDPVVVWSTAAASPSGAAISGSTLYVAALRGARLWTVPLGADGGAGTPVAELQGRFGRLRTVEVGPDGSLWVATSNRDGRGSPAPADDRVLRFPPAAS